jgi:hypothetical protein
MNQLAVTPKKTERKINNRQLSDRPGIGTYDPEWEKVEKKKRMFIISTDSS